MNWPLLADNILFCIFRAIVLSGSGRATSAFAVVCRPWHVLAASSKTKRLLASTMPCSCCSPTWGEAAMCPLGPESSILVARSFIFR